MNNLNTDLAQKVAEFIQLAGAISQRATKQANDLTSWQRAIDARVPAVVQALVDNGRITPDQTEKAAALLRDPLATLTILENTARHRSEQELQHLGEPYGAAKRAAAVRGGLDSPYCGARTTEKRGSDIEFERRILGHEISDGAGAP